MGVLPSHTIELLLKQKPEVFLNKHEVYPEFCAALNDSMDYGDKVMPLSEQVANKLESYPGHYSIDEGCNSFSMQHNILLSSREHFILKANHVDFLC